MSLRPVSAPAPSSFTDEERFDLKCLRYRNAELARLGCGSEHCPVETCAVARHARLLLRALDAIEAAPLSSPESVRTHLA